jgi:hypothetical protein
MSFGTKSSRSLAASLTFAFLAATGGSAPAQLASPLPAPSISASATALPSPAASFPSPFATATPTPTAPPPLTAQPANIVIGPGVSQAVKILGATPPLTAQVSSSIATVTIDQVHAFIYVSAVQLGTATIHVTDANGSAIDIPLNIAQPAGIVPSTLSLIVTGNPASSRFLQRQVRAALRRVIRPTLQPGASITFSPLAIPLQPLQPGFLTSIDIPVTVAGGNATAPVFATTTVTVQNLQLDQTVPSVLFYDDDPEYVQLAGGLFRGTVQPNTAARLYYYHDNLGLPKDIAVVLTPASVLPTRVQLIDVEGGPSLDVMSVGNFVSKSFLSNEAKNQGIVVDLSSQTPFLLRNTLALIGELVAGAVDVRVLMGGPVNVSVLALPAGDPLSNYVNAPLAPRDGHNRSGVFNIAGFGAQTVAYTVGGPDASTTYGGRDTAPPNMVPGSLGHDWGDYGVTHRFTFDIDNPTDTAQTVYLYEKPSGGATINFFLVDGQLRQMGCARVPERYEIEHYEVAPHAQLASNVVTMTDGGSSYPLEIGLTQTAPFPFTPPMDAPDGCFPKATPSPIATPVQGLPLPSGAPTELPSGFPVPASATPFAYPTPTPAPT